MTKIPKYGLTAKFRVLLTSKTSVISGQKVILTCKTQLVNRATKNNHYGIILGGRR